MKSYPENKVYIPTYKGLLDEAPLNVENLRLFLTVYAYLRSGQSKRIYL